MARLRASCRTFFGRVPRIKKNPLSKTRSETIEFLVELNTTNDMQKTYSGSSSNALHAGDKLSTCCTVQYSQKASYFCFFCVWGCRWRTGPTRLCWGNSGVSQILWPSLEGTALYKALITLAMTTFGQ